MCIVVYVASDVPLKTWPFSSEKPGFHVTDLDTNNEAVRKQFSKPFVYYAGAYENCGCGFQYGCEYPDFEDDPEELAKADKCRSAFATYLHDALMHQQSVEIYSCWSGDESEPPETRRTFRIDEAMHGFKERDFLTIIQAS